MLRRHPEDEMCDTNARGWDESSECDRTEKIELDRTDETETCDAKEKCVANGGRWWALPQVVALGLGSRREAVGSHLQGMTFG